MGDTQILNSSGEDAETETFSTGEEEDVDSQMSGIVWLKKEDIGDFRQFDDAEEVKLPVYTPNVVRCLIEDKYLEVKSQVNLPLIYV